MSLFLALAAAMAAVALLFLLVPVWRRSSGPAERWFGVLLLTVLIPGGGAATYLVVSSWQWDPQTRAQLAIDRLRDIAAETERAMDTDEDPEGWRSLGEFYMNMQDFEAAARAYGRAWQLVGPQDVNLTISFAEALMLQDAAGNVATAGQLLDEALLRAPDNPRGLWYGGLVAFSQARWSAAEQRWNRLLELDPPAPLARLLEERLIEIRAQRVAQGEAPPPPAGERAAGLPPAAGESATVSVDVALAPGLESVVRDGAVLFVILRAGAAGPPLAVQRLPVALLPSRVELSDRDMMLPGQRLAEIAGPLSLVARISQSGDVAATSGDLYGEGSAEPGGLTSLVIDSIVP